MDKIRKIYEECDRDLEKTIYAINYEYECGIREARQYLKDYLHEIDSPRYYDIMC